MWPVPVRSHAERASGCGLPPLCVGGNCVDCLCRGAFNFAPQVFCGVLCTPCEARLACGVDRSEKGTTKNCGLCQKAVSGASFLVELLSDDLDKVRGHEDAGGQAWELADRQKRTGGHLCNTGRAGNECGVDVNVKFLLGKC